MVMVMVMVHLCAKRTTSWLVGYTHYNIHYSHVFSLRRLSAAAATGIGRESINRPMKPELANHQSRPSIFEGSTHLSKSPSDTYLSSRAACFKVKSFFWASFAIAADFA